MRFIARGPLTLAFVLASSVASSGAAAQGTPSAPAPPPPGGGSPTATSGPSDAAEPAGAASGQEEKQEEKKAAAVPAAGYAYSDKPARASGSRTVRRHAGPTVNIPGFEQLPDGGSRLFVALSQVVPVEERRAQGSITYVLKNANVRVWNNTNALVTVHFNTPVSRARLVPSGKDLHFIVELRAAATPQFKISEQQDKSAMLTIDFPKGDYSAAPVTEAQHAAPKAAKTARGRGKKSASPPPEPAPAPAGPKP